MSGSVIGFVPKGSGGGGGLRPREQKVVLANEMAQNSRSEFCIPPSSETRELGFLSACSKRHRALKLGGWFAGAGQLFHLHHQAITGMPEGSNTGLS